MSAADVQVVEAAPASAPATRVFARVKTGDGVEIFVPGEAVALMGTVRDLVDTLGESETPIELLNVSSYQLNEFVRWISARNSRDGAEKEALSDVHGEYWTGIKSDTSRLLGLLLASNYLEFTDYLNLCTKATASMLVGCTPRQIREKFGLPDDLKDQREKEARMNETDTASAAAGSSHDTTPTPAAKRPSNHEQRRT